MSGFHDVNTLLQTGIMQQQIPDPKGATVTYRRVLELDPGNKYAWYNLGVMAQQDGRTADARADYDKALKSDASFKSALFNEAILLKTSDPDTSIRLMSRVLAIDPKAGTAHLHLGQVLAQQHRDREAADEFRRAVATDATLRSQVPEKFRDSMSSSETSSQAGSTE
ncbi:hypothetical protein BKI49_23410 [Streptomyces sp. Tue6028]|uniref:tetratricopeptide repeat protein n=1 Tax=Streptomyces sp. Tue6028 TaxID=2036037 RepID=UPI000BB3A4B7|nr:tetratricopeptide repeat protein [Streptomyces sp. Tue6028]PBC61542.1 hypothetical protein BKI49_23410 [Streptomyces sp. Tue6028]